MIGNMDIILILKTKLRTEESYKTSAVKCKHDFCPDKQY